jgi:tetratricopeptide (TPR) repeat protein
MLAIKKLVAPLPALTLTVLSLALFTGCAESGPRALLHGERLLREGNYAQAIQTLERAALLLPRDARAWNHLGLAYHNAGRLDDAVKAYQQALALDRNLAAVHYNLGCLHLERNNTPAALAELISFTGFHPNAPEGWAKLGTAQLRAHQLDAAEKSFRQAVKLDPRCAEAWNGLGLAQTQRRRYQEAFQQFNTAARAQPDYAPALLNIAIVSQQHLNGRSLALQKYREYLALQPRSPAAPGVRQIVNQLEIELHPPVRPPPTNAPPPTAALTQSVASQVAANKPVTNGATHKLPESSTTHPAPVVLSQRTNVPNSAPPPRVAATPSAPPARTESAPPTNVEIVRLPEDEPIKPARDATPVAEPRNLKTAATGTAATNSSVAATSPPARPKNGFTARLNPRNWFRSKDAPNAPVLTSAESADSPEAGGTNKTLTVASAARPAPLLRPAAARYKYRSPAPPKPGNRGDAERLLAQGVQAQERNRLSEAVDAYRQAANADPSFFDAHYNLGVAAYEAGDMSQCLLAYEYALAVNPISVKARFNFAVALQKSGCPRDAANELEKLLAADSSEARAQFALANLYAQQLGEPEKARAHYLRLLELEPQHPQATAIRYWLEANP